MDKLVKFRKSIMLILKACILASLILLFIGVWENNYQQALFSGKGNYLVIFSYSAILCLFVSIYGSFRIGVLRLNEIILSFSLSIFITNVIMFLELCLIARQILSPLPMLWLTVFQGIFIVLECYSANSVYFCLNHARHILAVFDFESDNLEVIKKMKMIRERYSIEKGISSSRDIEEIKAEIDKFEAVLICNFDESKRNEIIKYCFVNQKRTYILPSVNDIITNSAFCSQIFDTPVFVCRNRALSTEQKIIKRFLDIIFSLFGIIISSPIMIITAIAIKFNDGGPVFFKQNRVTEGGKIFNVFKFRSMIVNADDDGAAKATENDSRITKVGKIIRAIRIDELPQLFNILFGTMSLVGPRPERTENVYEYTSKIPEFSLRHRVKGGLTGYAQIYGKYNTTPKDKLNMDLYYIENYSLLLDIKLLLMTIKIMFMKESTEGFNETANKQVHKTSRRKIEK